jgi:predicted N-formylglutamate amidohydrolase
LSDAPPSPDIEPTKLLAADEPAAVQLSNVDGVSSFLIVTDHAGKRFPRCLGQLGLSSADCERHIAWDIGAGAVSIRIAKTLDAMLIRQTYTRLVIDCNRAPGTQTSIPDISEHTAVPGNVGLSEPHKAARQREIFTPYHQSIAAELDRRLAAGRGAVLISMHSFTPVFASVTRPWHIGLLYNRDPGIARILKRLLQAQTRLVIGDNEPYSVSDSTDYTIPVHGERRGLPHVAVEIRQDLIANESGQHQFADLFARLLPQVLSSLRPACAREAR